MEQYPYTRSSLPPIDHVKENRAEKQRSQKQMPRRNWHSPDAMAAGTLIPDLAASRMVGNKLLLSNQSPKLRWFCITDSVL